MPAPKITFGQSIRVDVVVDDEIRDIHSSCPCREQAVVHIGIFIGERTLSVASQVGGIQTYLREHRSRDHGVSAHQLRITGAVDMLRSSIHNPNDSSVIAREPRRRSAWPVRDIGAANKINFAAGKHFVNTTKPLTINLLVFINHSDKVTASGVNAGVQSVRPALALLKYVVKAPAKFRAVALNR